MSDDRHGKPYWKILAAELYPAAAVVLDGAVLFIENEGEARPYRVNYKLKGNAPGEYGSRGSWRVVTHECDTRKTECGCLLYLPDTGREILYKPTGKLISYVKTP